jgi:hypothetical protein
MLCKKYTIGEEHCNEESSESGCACVSGRRFGRVADGAWKVYTYEFGDLDGNGTERTIEQSVCSFDIVRKWGKAQNDDTKFNACAGWVSYACGV